MFRGRQDRVRGHQYGRLPEGRKRRAPRRVGANDRGPRRTRVHLIRITVPALRRQNLADARVPSWARAASAGNGACNHRHVRLSFQGRTKAPVGLDHAFARIQSSGDGKPFRIEGTGSASMPPRISIRACARCGSGDGVAVPGFLYGGVPVTRSKPSHASVRSPAGSTSSPCSRPRANATQGAGGDRQGRARCDARRGEVISPSNLLVVPANAGTHTA